MGGYVAPEWVEAKALDKLVPQEQQSVIVSRLELADYSTDGTHTHMPRSLRSHGTQMGPTWRYPHGRRAARCFQSSRERARAIDVVATPRRMRQPCGWR